jgi:hypothetical protein
MLVLAGLDILAPPAAAQEAWQAGSATGEGDAGEVVEREWYGRPMAIADALSLTAFIGGIALGITGDSPWATPLGVVGFAGYALGGPIVHLTRQRVGVAFGSLGLRVGAPLIGLAAGMLLGAMAWSGCQGGNACWLEGAAMGFFAGGLGGLFTAVIVDNAALARKPVMARRTALWVAPTYRPEERRTALSLCGTW